MQLSSLETYRKSFSKEEKSGDTANDDKIAASIESDGSSDSTSLSLYAREDVSPVPSDSKPFVDRQVRPSSIFGQG